MAVPTLITTPWSEDERNIMKQYEPLAKILASKELLLEEFYKLVWTAGLTTEVKHINTVVARVWSRIVRCARGRRASAPPSTVPGDASDFFAFQS